MKQICIVVIALMCLAQFVRGQTLFESVGGGADLAVRYFAHNADSSALIAVGNYAYLLADSTRANGVAQWDGTNWNIDGYGNGNGDTASYSSATSIFSVTIFHDTLFLTFANDRWHYDTTIFGAAHLINDQWKRAGNPFNHTWILQENGRLFTGDQTDTVNSVEEYGIHEWVGGGFRALPNLPFQYGTLVNASAYWQGNYYFGGSLSALGSLMIIGYDGDSTWLPLNQGLNGYYMNTIEGHGDSLYVGGFWDQPSRHIAIWNGSDWLPFFPEVQYDGHVTGLKSYDGALYVRGVYHFVGDTSHYGVLRWDGEQLCALGGPMYSDGNLAFEVFQNELYVGMAPTYEPLLQQYIAKLPLENIIPSACVVPSLVGVPDLETVGELSVYPNPATNSVRIACPEGILGQQVTLLNALGQVVLQERITGYATTLSLAGIAPGVYNIMTKTQDQRLVGRLMVE